MTWFTSPTMPAFKCTVINGWQFWHSNNTLRQAYSATTYMQFGE